MTKAHALQLKAQALRKIATALEEKAEQLPKRKGAARRPQTEMIKERIINRILAGRKKL